MKRKTLLMLIAAAAACSAGLRATVAQQKPNTEVISKMKITPILVVDEIEKSLPFWTERLGFTKTVEVPEGNRLAFVILVHDGAELMIQTAASVRKDVPAFAPKGASLASFLYIEVEDFQDVRKRLEGYPISMSEREAFYGMREIGVKEPCGNVVVFASPIKK
ncbi:MAG TPA: VOC family protein [Blastocatellia bacterium]|nr:VOC family protein [Blastocatellia bacterium]